MKFETKRHWTQEEDKILKYGYEYYGFNAHDPASKKIQTELITKLGIYRTTKAIHRRAYRLGIQTYIYGDVVIDTKCFMCGKNISTYKRHIKKYGKIKCKDCADKQKHEQTKNNPRTKEYQHYYYVRYKKEKLNNKKV